MFECCDNPIHLCQFPTELIIYIFKFLSVKNLVACRRVCKRWNEIVEDISSNDNLWENNCKNDFKTLFGDAKMKSNCSLWFDLYRSLSLWSRLSESEELHDEFCHSAKMTDTIENVYIVQNGVAAVHRRHSVAYYDISTLETKNKLIQGEYSKFIEFENFFLILNFRLHLRIIRKNPQLDLENGDNNQSLGAVELMCRDIKKIRIFGRNVYFVNFDNYIFVVNLDEKLKAKRLPRNYEGNVINISFHNESLHILTGGRNVYKLNNNTFEIQFNLETKKDNLFDCLWRYQLLEHMDWHIFYIWVPILNVSIPESPLRYLSMIKVYGDTIFIGCKNGVLQIYYKPYTDGNLDLINHKPVKLYKFSDEDTFPSLSLYPIISIEVIEIQGGHKLLIGMPQKIIILIYTHKFEVLKSKEIKPYVPPGLDVPVNTLTAANTHVAF